MRGRIPKDPALVQRRNKAATRATLRPADESRPAPRLPRHRDWHPMTRLYWRHIWRSPMAGEYLEADVDGLLILMTLVDRFWHAPTVQLERAIAQRGALFGLSPIDRRRLQWIVEKAEEREKPRQPSRPQSNEEMRQLLQVLQ